MTGGNNRSIVTRHPQDMTTASTTHLAARVKRRARARAEPRGGPPALELRNLEACKQRRRRAPGVGAGCVVVGVVVFVVFVIVIRVEEAFEFLHARLEKLLKSVVITCRRHAMSRTASLGCEQ